jgi:hypothetical protein
VKRIDLVKEITALGAVLDRHGSKHDWYVHHKKGVARAVPRHNEIKEPMARAIIKAFS